MAFPPPSTAIAGAALLLSAAPVGATEFSPLAAPAGQPAASSPQVAQQVSAQPQPGPPAAAADPAATDPATQNPAQQDPAQQDAPDHPDMSSMTSDEMAAMVDGMTIDGALEMMSMADIPPDIVVTGTRLRFRTSEIASSTVLTGEALATQARSTIGETLAHLPGASSTSFGPSASRPVLRGFQGERARLLIDGIGTLDASNTSPDHAVALNPLVADRIEVLRGPVANLYASGSIGGVVNSVSGRIARRAPRDGIDATFAAGFGSAADERLIAFRTDVEAAPRVVLHLDGQYLNAEPVRTGGFILGPAPRAEAAASADPGIAALADLRGRLPNTQFETWELGGGASLILDNGHVGFSFSNYESVYGLPTRFSLDPVTPVPDTFIDLDQQRVDVRFEIDGKGLLQSLRGRFGWADYKHNEIIVGGPITATFLNLGYEARLEAVLGRPGGLKATVGGQFYSRDFRVEGPAPLLPPTMTEQFALFTLQELTLDSLRLEGSIRYEHTGITSEVDPILVNPAIDRDFDLWSFSGGANLTLSDEWKLALNAHYSQRAPVVEELFTQGIDPGTQGQLIGNPNLGVETSFGVEAIARLKGTGYSGSATFYYTRFANYIFARESGVFVDGLPVFQFLQDGAYYLGFEVQGSVDLARLPRGRRWKADGLLDYTRATLDSGAAVPRIPPLRLLMGTEVEGGALSGRAEVEYVFPQTRISAFETTTPGFAMVNLSMTWMPLGEESRFQVRISAANLLDATGRRHASLLKDFAPLSGRDIRIGLKYKF